MDLSNIDFNGTGVTAQAGQRHTFLQFPSGRRAIVMTPPPGVNENPVRDALGHLLMFSSKQTAVSEDRGLNETGRQSKLQALAINEGTKTRGQMMRFEAKTAGEAASAEQEEAAFYALPHREPGDAVSVAEDQLILSHLNGLKGSALADAMRLIQNGEKPRWTLALQRMGALIPLPPGFAEIIPDAWRASVERSNPEAARNIKARLEAAEWGTSTMAALMAVAPK